MSDTPLMDALRLKLKYGVAVEIIHAIDIDADTRVIVFGDPSMGSYEWGIERCGKVEQHSDVGYGNVPAALRDGLMTAWPPMDDGLTPRTLEKPPGYRTGKRRLVYNKDTKQIDVVTNEGFVVDSFDPPQEAA